MFNWIPELDNSCRMWKCPCCGARSIGDPWDRKRCPYFFCYKCGSMNSDYDPGDDSNFPVLVDRYEQMSLL